MASSGNPAHRRREAGSALNIQSKIHPPKFDRLLKAGLLALLCIQSAVAKDEADWLARMDAALTGLDFHGVLVYRRGAEVDVLRLSSRATATGRQDRFERLTGEAESLARNGRDFVLGEGAERFESRPSAPVLTSPTDLTRLLVSYRVSMGGGDRVAGREARVLELRARDAFRYSQQLLLDVETALPLRARTLAPGDAVLEEWLFAEFVLGNTGDAATGETITSTAAREYSLPQPASQQGSVYSVVDLPQGFALSLVAPAAVDQSVQLVYSDGLVVVSAYVEPLRRDRPNLSGTHRRGALSVVGRVLDGMQITVVGAIPPTAAERIAQGLTRRHAG